MSGKTANLTLEFNCYCRHVVIKVWLMTRGIAAKEFAQFESKADILGIVCCVGPIDQDMECKFSKPSESF